MKIFHIISSLKMGGAEAFLYNFLSQVVHHPNEEHIVAYFHPGPFVAKIEALGIQTYQIKGLLTQYDPVAYLRLKKIIKTHNPDILHTSLWAANFLGRRLSKSLKIPLISELHGNCFHVSSGFKNWLDVKTLAVPHTLVAVADSVKQAYEQGIIAAMRDTKMAARLTADFQVIKNGIDADSLVQQALKSPLSRQDIGLSEHDFVIGSVGRLDAIKSYGILIQAFARLKKKHDSVKLCLVGDGPERDVLQKLAATLGVAQSVLFVGMRADAYRFYSIFDCFALSSRTEGLSLALLEALAFGLPIVTTHDSMRHEVITDQEHGFLVPVNDEIKFAEALECMVTDRNLLLRMKIACLERSKSFKICSVIDRYRMIYKKIAP